jgi:two-component system sensor histidine kinase KdpD
VAARASAHSEHVELRIVDHGRGLKKGTAESAFAPFQRLGDRDATPGVGLGLSVAKGFTEAMGGSIRAEDTPGGGLTVVICLPAYRGQDPDKNLVAIDEQTVPTREAIDASGGAAR